MKGVVFHAVLALLGLAAAYVVWTEGDVEERSAEAVTVVDCPADRFESVTLHEKARTVKVERRGSGRDRYSWITMTRAEGEGENEEAFAGSKEVDTYVGTVAPFIALRSLGTLSDEELRTLELPESETTFELRCGGQAHAFKVGGSAYGTGDRYIRATSGGPVFLVSADALRQLESAQFRLMQRDLHAFEWTDVERARLEGGGRTKVLFQRNHRDPQHAEWVDDSDRDRRNELYGNWLDRLQRLRIQKYLAPDSEPGSDIAGSTATAVPVLEATFLREGGEQIGHLELVKIDGTTPEYYARTESTRTWVKVLASVADQVERDLRPMLGLEPLPAPAVVDAGVPEVGDAAVATDGSAAPDRLQVPTPAMPGDEPAREPERGARPEPDHMPRPTSPALPVPEAPQP